MHVIIFVLRQSPAEKDIRLRFLESFILGKTTFTQFVIARVKWFFSPPVIVRILFAYYGAFLVPKVEPLVFNCAGVGCINVRIVDYWAALEIVRSQSLSFPS